MASEADEWACMDPTHQLRDSLLQYYNDDGDSLITLDKSLCQTDDCESIEENNSETSSSLYDEEEGLEFFLEPHNAHSVEGDITACTCHDLGEYKLRLDMALELIDEYIGEMREKDRENMEFIESDLIESIRKLFLTLVKNVPLCAFSQVLSQLVKISDTTLLVSTIISVGKLAQYDVSAFTNIAQRIPGDMWLFYSKWFVVVYQLTGEFPWFGDAQGINFWLAVNHQCPTYDAQLHLLNTLENVMAEEINLVCEDGSNTNEESADSSDNDGENNVPDQVQPFFPLEVLQNHFKFIQSDKPPYLAADIVRLSKQVDRRAALNDSLTNQCNQFSHLETVLDNCIYYLECIQEDYKIPDDSVDKFIQTWAEKLARSSKPHDDLENMQETLRQYFFLTHSKIQMDLKDLNIHKRQTLSTRSTKSAADLTLSEVMSDLAKSKLISPNVLNQVEHCAKNILSSSNDSADHVLDDPRVAKLKMLFHKVKQVKGFALYPVQLVAVILATINFKPDSEAKESQVHPSLASILQMETGEGKSITFAIIAAFHALGNKRVDIATSSEQLAADGKKYAAAIFDALDITHAVCGQNSTSSSKQPGKSCYSAMVVYSTISQLAGDYLRDVIFGSGGRSGRPFEILLLDEVDAALVDGAANMTMLSMPVAGMELLNFFHGAVYSKVKRTIELEGDSAAMPHFTDPDFRRQVGLPQITTELTRESDQPSDEVEMPQMIPKHLLSSVDLKFQVYIDQMWTAYTTLKQGREYDNINDKIVVIDSKTSGEIQESSVYGEGLHQFLQIHKGTKLTPESLNAVYISNGSFVQKYKVVVGITGTIGTAHDQTAIQKALRHHQVNFALLPRSKYRPYTQLPTLVLSNANSWRACWLQEIQRCQTIEKRPVLLIFSDKATAVKEASYIESELGIRIKRYIINDRNYVTFDAAKEKLGPLDVVVSTNFGGRGTDYRLTPEARENGGLHTVLTFYANNSRMIKQAFGRSARAGQPGSGVLITFNGMLPYDLYSRRAAQERQGDAIYRESLSDQLKTNLPLNEACDQLFELFSNFHRQIGDKLRRSQNPINRHYFLQAHRNRFGLFIDTLRHNPEIASLQEKSNGQELIFQFAQSQYNAWKKEIDGQLNAGSDIITNERELVVYSREIVRMVEQRHRAFSYDGALNVLERALASDPAMAGTAGNMLVLKIHLKKKKWNARLDDDYNFIRGKLLDAQTAFGSEIETLTATSYLLVGSRINDPGIKGSALETQMTELVNIAIIMRNYIDAAIAELDKAHSKKGESDDDKFKLVAKFEDLPDDASQAAKEIYKEYCASAGHIGLLTLQEEREWSWDWNAFGCVLLGLAQVLGGAAALIFSAGAFGAGLIMEGVSDMATGIIAIAKGDGSFSWKDYIQNKLISIAISVVCSGVCKVGKFLYKVGRTAVKSGLTAAKEVWKTGLRAARTSIVNGAKRAISRAKEVGVLIKNASVKVARTAFKEGMMKAGNQLGKVMAKQVLIAGANIGVDYGIQAAFGALEASIATSVKESVKKWTITRAEKIEKLAEAIDVRLLNHLVDECCCQMQNNTDFTQDLLRQFGDGMVSAISKSLVDTKNTKHCKIALGLRALHSGAKWAEVILKVESCTQKWLDNVDSMLCAKVNQIGVFNIDSPTDESCTKFLNSLGLDQLTINGQVVWKFNKKCVATADDKMLKKNEAFCKLPLSVQLRIKAARDEFVRAMEFDAKVENGYVPTANSLQYHQFIQKLSDAITSVIRQLLEKRTAAMTKAIVKFGMEKLVDKASDAYLKRKATKLFSFEPQNDQEAEIHTQKIQRFLADNEVSKAVENGVLLVAANEATNIAHAHAIAVNLGVSIELVQSNGKVILINEAAMGKRLRINEQPGAFGTMKHVIPQTEADSNEEAYVDSASDKSCFYRAIFYAHYGRNADESDLDQLRTQTVQHLLKSEVMQLLLYVNRNPKQIWGGESGRNKATGSTKYQKKMNEKLKVGQLEFKTSDYHDVVKPILLKYVQKSGKNPDFQFVWDSKSRDYIIKSCPRDKSAISETLDTTWGEIKQRNNQLRKL